jgi:hypothetical protein
MEPCPCPSCGESAERVPPETVGFVFQPSPTAEGPVPQNTGVSSYDYEVDRIVGAEAQERWGAVEKREALKRSVMRESGASKQDLSALPDGSYRVMAPEEKSTTRNTRAFHNLAAGLAKSKDRYRVLRQVSERGS